MIALLLAAAAAQAPNVERIIFVRHGEKPAGNFGQLTCQGLNRSLELPRVLLARYGKPDFIFAPDPKQLPNNPHRSKYDYLRALATIEPTAIQLSLPVNTQFDTEQSMELVKALETPQYAHALVFIAWQHTLIVEMARALLKDAGNAEVQVPDWAEGDYDGIFVLEIAQGKATFKRETEGLDGLSPLCPAQK
jgi:hypothetical protein